MDDLNKIDKYISSKKDKSIPILMTGFNRRFSPYAVKIASILKNRKNPFLINYRMNAGYIPLDHWVHNEEGGGRNIGEACHIYDLFTYISNSKITSISANSIVPTSKNYTWNDCAAMYIFTSH